MAPPITWAAEADAKDPGEDAGAKAAEAFESLYGQDVERVRGTSEPADDIALAKRLLSAARDATGTPALLKVLCNEAYTLAAAYPDGYPTAVEAAACLASHVPSSAVDAADRIVAVRQKQYARAEGEAKAAAGATLVEALVRLADAHVEAMTYPQAIAALKRAARVSRSVGGDRLRAIEARRERARFLLRTRRDIANMKDLIEREPANTSAREKLVRLYLVHLDDPAAAAKHLDGVEDEELLKYVPAVGKGVESAPELACMELGDWYRRLGESAPTPAKRAMFERAKAYYERFLSLHEAADLKRMTATLALKKVESLLADLIPPEATPAADATGGTTAGEAGTEDADVPESGVIKPGTWVDLLPLVDPEKHTVKGTWKREGGRLAITDKVEQGRIVIPVMPSGSYRLHCEFVRASGTDAVYWQLPVGPSAVGLMVGGRYDSLFQIIGKEPADARRGPSHIKTGQSYSVDITVRWAGDKADIAVRLNGKPHLSWSGPPSDLSVHSKWRLPQKGMLGLGAYESQVMFRHLRLKMLSGEARVLRVASEDQSRYEFGPDTHLESEYTPQIAGKPLRITATFRAEGDGVLIAQGGSGHGYALYVKDRRLCFATRHNSRLSVVESNVRLAPAPMTAVAVLAPNGQVTLTLEGKMVGTGRVPGPLVGQPYDGLQVGRDAVSRVGPYEKSNAFAGRIERVTLKVGK